MPNVSHHIELQVLRDTLSILIALPSTYIQNRGCAHPIDMVFPLLSLASSSLFAGGEGGAEQPQAFLDYWQMQRDSGIGL